MPQFDYAGLTPIDFSNIFSSDLPPPLFPMVEESNITCTNNPINTTEETAHDLQVKYQETYGLHNNKPIYFYEARSMESSPNKYEIRGLYIKRGETEYTNFTSYNISEFNMLVPKLGFINHDNLCLFIERKHKKASPTKYRKGLRSDNLLITNISSADYKEAYNKRDPYSTYDYGEDAVLRKILHSLFFPKFYTYADALSSLFLFKRLSCAISSNIAIALNFKTNKIMLYRNQFVIGFFNKKTSSFKLETDLFIPDLIKLGVKIE